MPGVDPGAMDFLPAPDRARRRAWLQFRNLGVAHNDLVLAARRGFLTRRVAVIPHARTQSVGVTQGPWQRRLGLASVQVDSTPGPVSIVALHRTAGEARRIAEEQLVRAGASRASGPGERWMTRPMRPVPADPVPADRIPADRVPDAPGRTPPIPTPPVPADPSKAGTIAGDGRAPEFGQGSP